MRVLRHLSGLRAQLPEAMGAKVPLACTAVLIGILQVRRRRKKPVAPAAEPAIEAPRELPAGAIGAFS